MAKVLSKEELEKRGARKIREAPKKEPDQTAAMLDSVRELAGGLSSANEELATKLVTAIKDNQSRAKPITYEFIIDRDKRGLLSKVTAIPLET